MEKIIYKGGRLNLLSRIIITVFFIVIIVLDGIFLINTHNVLFIIIPILSFILINWLTRKSIAHYDVYVDKIEIRNRFSKKVIETIFLKDINQVRFEDEFSHNIGGNPFSQDLIFLYPRAGFESKFLQEDKLILPVFNVFQKTKRLTTLLRIFQDARIELYVITKRKQLLQDLNIRNWNNP